MLYIRQPRHQSPHSIKSLGINELFEKSSESHLFARLSLRIFFRIDV
jgi:hypothetical protein